MVLVGPQACQLDVAAPVTVVRARSDFVVHRNDPATEVPVAVASMFEGPDADRFRRLAGSALRRDTEMLWAAAEVAGSGLSDATEGLDVAVVVGWVDEVGLVPALRAIGPPTVVLLGGGPVSRDPTPADPRAVVVDATHTVLADGLRRGEVWSVFTSAEPDRVLWMVVEQARTLAARSGSAAPEIGSAPLIDLGPPLGLPTLWCPSAPPVAFTAVAHLPMGPTPGLPRLALAVAAWRALRDVVRGPPVDIHAVEEVCPPGPRVDQVADSIGAAVDRALGGLPLEGEGPLVDAIAQAMVQVEAEVDRILQGVAALEAARLSPLSLFSACGIDRTVAELTALERSTPVPSPDSHRRIRQLLDGSGIGGGPVGGEVHLTAWRIAFAGLSQQVAPRGSPGRDEARELVATRLDLFRGALKEALSEALVTLVQRGRDPTAPAPLEPLRSLLDRARRVQGVVAGVLDQLWGEALEDAEAVLRLDALTAWLVEPSGSRAGGDGADVAGIRGPRWLRAAPGDLLERVLGIVDDLAATPALDRGAMDLATQGPLGTGDDAAFEAVLGRLRGQLLDLASFADRVPNHDAVLMALLAPRDPGDLAGDLSPGPVDPGGAQSPPGRIELCLPRDVGPEVERWLRATGLPIRTAPGPGRSAVSWTTLRDLGHPAGRRRRRAVHEHHAADLVLPRPTGDTQATLVDRVNARVVLWVGSVLGSLTIRCEADSTVYPVAGLGLPDGLVLPYEALHVLTEHPQVLGRAGAEIDAALGRLPQRSDAASVTAKLWELGTLGPSPDLVAALGLGPGGQSPLQWAVQALLRREAERAIAAWVDCAPSRAIVSLMVPVEQHTLVDVRQLGPGS